MANTATGQGVDGVLIGVVVDGSACCNFSREELTRLASESGYGANAAMFDTFFVRPPRGSILCATCERPIGVHGSMNSSNANPLPPGQPTAIAVGYPPAPRSTEAEGRIGVHGSINSTLAGAVTYRAPSGEACHGHWTKEYQNGFDTLTSAGGHKYSGQWQNGKKHGRGKYDSPEFSYDGEWVADDKHGWGTYTFQSGASYVGGWSNDQMHGTGIYTFASGKKNKVTYKNGTCQERVDITDQEASRIIGQKAVTPAPAATAPDTATTATAATTQQAPAPQSTTNVPVATFPDWLMALPISDDVRATFVREQVTEDVFALLEADDLRELGVPMGARKLILKQIERRKVAGA